MSGTEGETESNGLAPCKAFGGTVSRSECLDKSAVGRDTFSQWLML